MQGNTVVINRPGVGSPTLGVAIEQLFTQLGDFKTMVDALNAEGVTAIGNPDAAALIKKLLGDVRVVHNLVV